MTRTELKLHYQHWAKSIGLKRPPPLEKKRVTVWIRDVLETDQLLIGQIHYVVPIYTNKLNTFTYSMQTIWKKDWKDDTSEILDETYSI